tara:strand:- start:68 stop:247 length:180 start_codon:yes stop_codon:yes gene_type:complete
MEGPRTRVMPSLLLPLQALHGYCAAIPNTSAVGSILMRLLWPIAQQELISLATALNPSN